MTVISTQHTVRCYKKKTAPRGIRRGSATTDDQFAYYSPLGFNTVYSYRWITERWEQLLLSPYRNYGLVIIDSELTAVGGWNGSHRTNKLFTLRQGRWVEYYPPLKTECYSPAVASTSDGNYIFVIGGASTGHNWTATVELFHVRSKRWYELTNLPQTLSFPSATICGNQLHVIGRDGAGYSCSIQAVLSSDQPTTLTWTPLPELPVKWSTASTIFGQLIIVGGEQDGSFINSIHQLIDGEWVVIGFMSSGRSESLVVSPSQDKIIIVGGYGEDDGVEECVVTN